MKRFALPLATAIVLVSFGSANAQDLALGLRGGLNLAGADATGDLFGEDVGSLAGFHFGLLGSFQVTRNFGLQTNVLYTRKGFGTGKGVIELAVDYIEIPVLATLTFPGRIAPHFYLGPALGLEMRCRASTDGEPAENCDDAEGGPATRGSDFGLMLGGGVSLAFGRGSLLLDAFYQYGLTDIAETTTGVESIETRTLQLSAGYTLPIGNARD